VAAPSLLAACSSNSGGGTTATDGGGEGAATGDAGQVADSAPAHDAPGEAEAAAACNAIANVAQTVTGQQVAQDPPQPQGGAIADGTYTLTDFSIYTGPSGPTGASGSTRITVQIAAGTLEVASDSKPSTMTVSLVTSGTTFTATDTCPDANVTHGSFSATPTKLLIFLDGGTDDAGQRTVIETYTKQ
jgi:hypothetical protein